MGREGAVTRCHVLVRGKVQGVGFRWFVRERAKALGVAGRVCNQPDGSVEVEAEGDARSIATLLDQLRAGPPGAKVLGIEPMSSQPNGPLPMPFAIER
jgi:acylphosphatase